MYEMPEAPKEPPKQYKPSYYLVEQKEKPVTGDYISIHEKYYSILPDPDTVYYLYNSIRLFFQNGGGSAYIVSMGTYGEPSGKAMEDPDANIINPNIKLQDLQNGLTLLKNEVEPTIYICPEAILL